MSHVVALVEFLRYRVVFALQKVFLDVVLNKKNKSKQLLKHPPPFEGKALSQLPGVQLEPLNVQHSEYLSDKEHQLSNELALQCESLTSPHSHH